MAVTEPEPGRLRSEHRPPEAAPPEHPRPDDHVVVLFGATGDLARRKLLPGLFHLHAAGLLPQRCKIIGTAPAEVAPSAAEFAAHARDAVERFAATKPDQGAWEDFAALLDFAPTGAADAGALVEAVQRAEATMGGHPRRLFHLAIPPAAFVPVVGLLGNSGLAEGGRVVVEKPFGSDLDSARALNHAVHAVFDEQNVYRIDHFLGKESIDNILAFRFSNGLFEPVWNRDHVAYVQIDVPETLTLQGRAGFYESTGAYRDMVVTHLLQVLGFVAMEPPARLSAEALATEKQKVFDAILPVDPHHAVFGQYEGYRSETGVAPDSATETFAAARIAVENWRWAGVPFYLRTGKALAASRQLVVLGFKEPVLQMLPLHARPPVGAWNEIAIDFADPGSITLRFWAKEPGPSMRLGPAEMVFSYGQSFCAANELEGYERLILEAMTGDRSLFTTAAQVERLWEVSAPLLAAPPPVEPYPQGSWGPSSAAALARPHGWPEG